MPVWDGAHELNQARGRATQPAESLAQTLRHGLRYLRDDGTRLLVCRIQRNVSRLAQLGRLADSRGVRQSAGVPLAVSFRAQPAFRGPQPDRGPGAGRTGLAAAGTWAVRQRPRRDDGLLRADPPVRRVPAGAQGIRALRRLCLL